MEEIKTIARKWGNSIGIRLPKIVADRQNIKDGTEVNITITPKHKMTVSDLLNISKGLKLTKKTKTTEEIMNEIDKELWGIEK